MRKTMVLLIVLTLTLLNSGCASSRLPARLSAEQRKKVKSTKLPYIVAIEEYKYPAYSESMETNLKNTKVFKSVENEYRIKEYPDLVAKVHKRIYGTACFPLFTLLTLGIIPSVVDENHGDSFFLSSPKNPNKKVEITYYYRDKSILGWYALFLNFFPDWKPFPESSQRYLDQLSYAIVKKAPEIKALVKHHPASSEANPTRERPK